MNKDPFSTFIEDRTYLTTIKYYNLIYKTKIIFFECLLKGEPLEEFKKKSDKLWKNIDHKFMQESLDELYKMIDLLEMQDKTIINEEVSFKEVFELVPTSKFTKIENKYKDAIDKYYSQKLKVVKKDYVDTKSYLSKVVEKYDEEQKIIPYFNKDGTIRSYHNIASYCSMLYNTNLTHGAWNRTMYDSELLENDLMYLPAHTFACPLCMPYQGKVYSKSGRSTKYPPMEEAINGGVGHPNCRHVWVLYWGKDQIQENDYNSDEWEEKYKNKQKIKSLQLRRTKLKNDKEIFKILNNYEEVDKTNAKIKKINATIKDQKSIMNGESSNYLSSLKIKQKQQKEQEKLKIKKEKEIKIELQKQSSKTHKEMQELFKIRENRPKYIEELNRKQDKLKEVRKIIRKNKKDNAYYMAKQEELSLKVDIKNLKELINK